MAADAQPYQLLDRVFREEAGRLTATLVRLLGDFDLAEELVADAVVEALEHWPREGPPERPASWLLTTARRKGLDRLRRDTVYRDKLAAIARMPAHPTYEPDERLTLMFTCCHPALSREAQIALTLRAAGGLTTREIARAFLASEETIKKRIARAKAKIVAANVPFRLPSTADVVERLHDVLTVIYVVFNEGYVATSGPSPLRRDLAQDAEWLAMLVVRLMPDEPEALALLALIRLHLARWSARLDSDGRLVLLEHQDRARWDRTRIAGAIEIIERTAKLRRPGRYQVEAMIAALHCEASSWEQTDWPQILALYDVLVAIDPSPVVRLNRAVAVGHVHGPGAALAEVERLSDGLSAYHLWHATRASLLAMLGRDEDAGRANATALELTRNAGERALIEERLGR